jgi:hypothetical protein
VSKSGCKLWDPSPEENEAVEWSGDCKDGFSNGPGSETWFKGEVRGNVVEGNAISGKMAGEVTAHYINGDVYIGNLSPYDGNRDGHGVMNYSNGSKYDGNWSHGFREGYGEYFSNNGGYYKEIGMQINSMAMESFDIATDVFISGNFWREIEMAPEN